MISPTQTALNATMMKIAVHRGAWVTMAVSSSRSWRTQPRLADQRRDERSERGVGSERAARDEHDPAQHAAVGVAGRERRVDVVAEPREPVEEALIAATRVVHQLVGELAEGAERAGERRRLLLKRLDGRWQLASDRQDRVHERLDLGDGQETAALEERAAVAHRRRQPPGA